MSGTRSALDQASAPTRQRIAADTRQLPMYLRPVLETIGDRLFDPDLTFQAARESHGIRDKNTAATFRQALGLPPAQYIRERRMEVAAELLRRTRLPVWRVGMLVGYLQHQSFSRAFRGWAGQAPMPFRQVEAKLAEAARPSPGAGSAWLARERLRRALRGVLSAAEIARLEEELVALRPELATPAEEPARPTPREERLPLVNLFEPASVETIRAEELTAHLAELAPSKRLRFLREGLSSVPPALSDRLFRAALEIGRTDRLHGAELAEALVELLARCEARAALVQSGRLAVALARLGHAQRLALDLPAAGESLASARELLRPELQAVARGEVILREGVYLRHLRRFEEARERQEESIALLREADDGPLLAEALMELAMTLLLVGDPDLAVDAQREALDVVLRLESPYHEHAALFNLARIELEAGRVEEARKALGRARTRLPSDPEIEGLYSHLEGWFAMRKGDFEGATRRFRVARTLLSGHGSGEKEALVVLDLAIAAGQRGDEVEAVELAGEALAFFSSMCFGKEARMALVTLRGAIEMGALTVDLLSSARREIDRELLLGRGR